MRSDALLGVLIGYLSDTILFVFTVGLPFYTLRGTRGRGLVGWT